MALLLGGACRSYWVAPVAVFHRYLQQGHVIRLKKMQPAGFWLLLWSFNREPLFSAKAGRAELEETTFCTRPVPHVLLPPLPFHGATDGTKGEPRSRPHLCHQLAALDGDSPSTLAGRTRSPISPSVSDSPLPSSTSYVNRSCLPPASELWFPHPSDKDNHTLHSKTCKDGMIYVKC